MLKLCCKLKQTKSSFISGVTDDEENSRLHENTVHHHTRVNLLFCFHFGLHFRLNFDFEKSKKKKSQQPAKICITL